MFALFDGFVGREGYYDDKVCTVVDFVVMGYSVLLWGLFCTK